MRVESSDFNDNCPSRKQKILAELMHWLICLSRGAQSWRLRDRLLNGQSYRRAFDDLNLIHRIPHSILDSEYVENDISFINWGIGRYVSERKHLDSRTAWLLIEFVRGVPESLRSKLTWSPSPALSDLAQNYEHELLYEDARA